MDVGSPHHVYLQQASIEDILQPYLREMHRLGGAGPDGDGRFHYRWLDHYWTPEGVAAGRVPFLILVDGEIAGFILRSTHFLLGHGEPTSNVAEFFVLPAFHRTQVGKRAARAVYDTFPGRWEVAQLRENRRAHAFWRAVISDYTQGNFAEHDIRSEQWDGSLYTFATR